MTGTQFHDHDHDHDHDHAHDGSEGASGGGSGRTSGRAGPVYSATKVADWLTKGYWQSNGHDGGTLHFDARSGDTLTVNVTALALDGQAQALKALDAWANVTGLTFTQTSGLADISFDDSDSGAYADFWFNRANEIQAAVINVSADWAGGGSATDSYVYQTYLHEIGHALGLGHGGNYNGYADYGRHNHYANDSWQMSVMSYFSQSENWAVDADYAYAITPMTADILAMRKLYGGHAMNAGDTVYGTRGNTGTALDDFASLTRAVTMTIWDDGGQDTIDLSASSGAAHINLTPGRISDILGDEGNMVLGRGTVIENVITGGGADRIVGNNADNMISSGGGHDTVSGGRGNDRLSGGTGDDVLTGSHGSDELHGDAGADTLDGGNHNDSLFGGEGNDFLNGSKGHDVLDGGANDDTLIGGKHNDMLSGGSGDDLLSGGKHVDVLEGDAGSDRLFGGTHNDTLSGGADNDMLDGGKGRDRLDGGTGDDDLWGGKHSDVFIFYDGCGADTVWDMATRGRKADKLDVSGLTSITDWSDLVSGHVSDTTEGCLIDAGGGDSILLAGLSFDDLGRDDFLF